MVRQAPPDVSSRTGAHGLEEGAERSDPQPLKAVSDRKAVLLLSSLGGIIGGLCCLAPIILVLFGLASISAAASLGNVLYGEYRWLFRTVALVFLAIGLVVYFRKRGICSLEEAKRQRTRLANGIVLTLITFTAIYILWTYVILHYWGIAAGLPWEQYDERWAIPASALAVAAAAIAFLVTRNANDKPNDKRR